MRRWPHVALLTCALGCSRAGDSRDAGADAVLRDASALPPGSVSAGSAAVPAASAAVPAASAAVPAASAANAEPSGRRGLSGAPGSGLEARRSSVARVEAEPVLAANVEALRKQYGGVLPASLAVQATDLGADRRRAILVGAERKDATLENPMLFVVDEGGAVVWSKERPTAGIKTPIGPIAIAAGPLGRFALAVCDPPTSSLALRLWDPDGSPFADFQALETKTCDAVTLLYWPGHGWLLVAAGPTETRAQLVTEAGALAWGPGRTLGARFRTTAPVSLASDSTTSFVLVQYSQSPGVDRDVDHALAFRYEASGQPLWPAPIDLGAVRRITPGQERIALTRSEGGVLRALLTGGVTIEIRSNGETRRVP